MIVVFLGPPGAGKGTQCKTLVDKYGLKHISSGDILRRERKQGTDLGKKAQKYMDSGQLVPDDLIVAMMMTELQNDVGVGFILDGFPRTVGQAEALGEALEKAGKSIDIVLDLEVDDEKLEERITGRRSCPKCGAAYHVTFMPPKNEGACDNTACGDAGKLVQRPDDTAEVVKNRIKNYHELTAPLQSFYGEQNVLSRIDGNAAIEDVTNAVIDAMDAVAIKGV